LNPGFGRGYTGKDLIDKAGDDTFFVILACNETTAGAEYMIAQRSLTLDFHKYLANHKKVWSFLNCRNENEEVDNKLRALSLWMCKRLAPHITRCALMSGDAAISYGTWLHPKNNNWDRVLRESLSRVLGEGKVFPLDIEEYVATKSKRPGRELKVTELLEGITTKTYKACVKFNRVQEPQKGKLKNIWQEKMIKGKELQAKIREARLALAGKHANGDSSNVSANGAGIFASGSDSDDSSAPDGDRRRLIGRLDETSKRCTVAA